MGREGRDYWEAQLSEYWDSGLTIQEYSELKELPYESTRRWIRVLEKVSVHHSPQHAKQTASAFASASKRSLHIRVPLR